MADINIPLTTVYDVRLNAFHLACIPDEAIQDTINDVHTIYIKSYYRRWQNLPDMVDQLAVIEKYLAQFTATLNVRRADSESAAGMSKSLSVPKDMDLDQNEYGQMARKLGKRLKLDWALDDDEPAGLTFFNYGCKNGRIR